MKGIMYLSVAAALLLIHTPIFASDGGASLKEIESKMEFHMKEFSKLREQRDQLLYMQEEQNRRKKLEEQQLTVPAFEPPINTVPNSGNPIFPPVLTKEELCKLYKNYAGCTEDSTQK
jgi:hypothetical protein